MNHETDWFARVTPIQHHQIKIGALVFGVRDSEGVDWLIQDVTDWSSTAVHSESADRPWGDGVWLGRQWISAKRFEIRLSLVARSYDAAFFESRVDAILKELPIRKTMPMVVKRWESVTVTMVRIEESVKVIPVDRRRWDISIQCIAPEILRYAADWETGQVAWDVYETGLPKKSGGLRVPFMVPFIIKSETVAGELRFIVGGSARPLALIEVTGPVKNPVIRDAVAGWRVAVNLDISAGERLVIDPTARTVELNGASRRGAISGGFPVIDVGEHLITWSADSYTPEARLKIRVAESYL